MRCLLLAVVAGLAFLAIGTHAEDAVQGQEPENIEFDFDDETLAQMLGDMFDDSEFDPNFRESRARDEDETSSAVEEKSSPVDAKDQARYNSFIDTFLRRLNSFTRSRFDPLSVGLTKKSGKSGKSGNAKKGKGKNSGKKGKKSEKKGDKKKDGDKKKSGGKKKKDRHPKNLDVEEMNPEEVEGVAVEAEEEVEEHHEIVKREVLDVVEIEEEEEDEESDLEEEEDEEDSLVRVTRDAAVEEEESSAVEETARKGKPAEGAAKKGAKKGGKKGGKKGKNNSGRNGGKKGGNKSGKKGGNKSGKKGGNNSGKKGGKKSGKKSDKSKRSTKSKGPRTSRASVSGIATLQRDGDVTVRNHKGGKEMRAKFNLGPIDLKINRKYGKGKKTILKEARAVAPQLTGKMAIQVAQNGKAKLTNFLINRPSIVQVEGSLHKSTKGGKTDNNFLENSISRFSPIAAKKLKIASREILSAGEPKSISDS